MGRHFLLLNKMINNMWIVIGSSDGARKYILNRGVFPFAIIEDE